MSISRRVAIKVAGVAVVLNAATLHAQSQIDTAVAAYKVGALQIIHQRRTANQTVAVKLYLLGGARQVDARTAGIEPLLLRAAAKGTQKYPGAEAQAALERTGSFINVDAEDDWTVVSLRTIRSELDSAWMVFADRIMRPSLRDDDIDDARRELLAELVTASSNPDVLLQQIARPIGFGKHPYANDPSGTDASLRSIRLQSVRQYHAESVVASRMLLVVVGNVDRASVERLIKATFSGLADGNYQWTLPPPVPPRSTSMTIIPRQLATDYIIGIFPGPLANTREYGPFRVGTGLLGSFLNYEIREMQQLSYAAYAPLYNNVALAGAVYASTTQPERVMDVMVKQIESVANEGLPLAYMPRFVSQFEIDDLTERASNSGQADALARAFLIYNDVTAVNAAFQALRATTPGTLRGVTGKYVPGIQFVFMGDTSRFRKFMK